MGARQVGCLLALRHGDSPPAGGGPALGACRGSGTGRPEGLAACRGLASPWGSLLVGIAAVGGLLPAPGVPSAVVETLSKSASWCDTSNCSPFPKAQPLRGVCSTARARCFFLPLSCGLS